MKTNTVIALGAVSLGIAVALNIAAGVGRIVGNLLLKGFDSALRGELFAASGAFKFAGLLEITGVAFGGLICLVAFAVGLYFFTKND